MQSDDFDVTAVVTTFQSEATIESALLSVSGQSVPASSVLVVDDGSTDETVARAADVSGVQVARLKHSGLVARSRNLALEQAATEYVAFLDADDQWAPNHLEWAQELLKSPVVGLVCGNALRVLGTVTDVQPFFAHLEPSSPYVSSRTPYRVPFRDLIRTNPIVVSSVVVRRSLLLSAGGFSEDLEQQASVDFGAWCRVLRLGEALYDPRVHVMYNQGPESMTRGSQEDRGRGATISVLESMLDDPRFDEFDGEIRRRMARDQLIWARRCLQRSAYFEAGRHLLMSAHAVLLR